MKTHTLLLAFVLLIASCGPKLNAQDSRDAIMHYYSELSLADGSGTYTISSIEITSQEKQSDGKWLVKARVTGSFENASLPDNEGPKPFDYENEYTLEKQDKIWKVVSMN